MHSPANPHPHPSLTDAAGVGLRHIHVPEFLAEPQPVGWLEVHAENYLVAGGPRLAQIERLRQDYPFSFHSVALSLGQADGVDVEHLNRLRVLYDRFEPVLVSDHLAWAGVAGTHIPDLLPMPLIEETLDIVARNVSRAQDVLGRRMLVENPSLYLSFQVEEMEIGEFLAALVKRTGCGLLLDINNLYVSSQNRGLDAAAFLARFPGDSVGEIHLAGHARVEIDGSILLVDDHGSVVPDAVWALYDQSIRLFGPRPTLIEWDTALPPLSLLLAQSAKADAIRKAALC